MTPPTPDRAAVREALVRVLENCPPHFVGRLGDHLATKRDWTCEAIADALLRPAPPPADVQAAVELLREVGGNATIRAAGDHHLGLANRCLLLAESLAHLTLEAR